MNFEVSEVLKEKLKDTDSALLKQILGGSFTLDESLKSPVSYLDIAKDKSGYISFLDKNRFNRIDDGTYYDQNKRLMAKPGKVFRRLFPDVPDSEIEAAVNSYKSLQGVDGDSPISGYVFELIKGEDITKYYLEDNHDRSYNESLSTLANSCMRHSTQTPLVQFYADNPDVISMLILKNCSNSCIIGRAIVWKDVNINGTPVNFMDRVYGNDHIIKVFCDKANKAGWARKVKQNYEASSYVILNGSEQKAEINITNLKFPVKKFPYMDTFKYTDNETFLNNFSPRSKYHLEDVRGEWRPGRGFRIVRGGEIFAISETVQDTNSGEYYHKDECVYSNYHKEYIFGDNTVQSRRMDSILRESESIELHDGDWVIMEKYLTVKIDGKNYIADECFFSMVELKFYPKADLVFSEYFNDYILAENAVLYKGDYYTEEALREIQIKGKDYKVVNIDTDFSELINYSSSTNETFNYEQKVIDGLKAGTFTSYQEVQEFIDNFNKI